MPLAGLRALNGSRLRQAPPLQQALTLPARPIATTIRRFIR
jgi:hypothetical protein